MATIQSLPAETLYRILELAADVPAESSRTRERDIPRRKLLASTALVARSWLAPSQSLLWKKIRGLSSNQISKLVAANPPRAYRTRAVMLAETTETESSTLLQHLHGITELQLYNMPLYTDLLLLPSVRDLSSLTFTKLRENLTTRAQSSVFVTLPKLVILTQHHHFAET
ncbi:hypothetical protein MNV49_004495 [Pseudohyphozyma bogoriensis]|nr:hypothetical protein MNV49_004495 [Pseudohyphozyma bogoriensis]